MTQFQSEVTDGRGRVDASGEAVDRFATDRTSDVRSTADDAQSGRLRRGAMWGAGVGFLLGIIPLLISTIISAIAGALLAKASELRIERGALPRIRSRQGNKGQETTLAK
jgi:uncharacterized membrane protein